jgi:hypothetical protein
MAHPDASPITTTDHQRSDQAWLAAQAPGQPAIGSAPRLRPRSHRSIPAPLGIGPTHWRPRVKLIRNLLAVIGLITLIALLVGAVKIGPRLAGFDPKFASVYAEFAGKLMETGDPGVAMMWGVPVDEGLDTDDVIESLKSLATNKNLLFVGESPFYKQVEAITGEPYRYVNFLSFCDAGVGRMMLEYRDQYSGFMPCRIALVEDGDGRLWLFSMNLDLMIHGGQELPDKLKTASLRVRDTLREIMLGAAAGEF